MPSEITQELTLTVGAQRGRKPAEPEVVIDVLDLNKTFRVPEQRIDTLKERATHPFRPLLCRELRALRQISFDVRRGEFFGIVGRNGSGKSTLLKILASIYRADAGRVRIAGRVAPFVELGVGFNPELTARENGVLNGVLMGLTMREARRRLRAVVEFAELEDFVDLKLKNYSSGMMVRFAFAIMVQADADVMLIDEVLAVGDAAFAQKCMDVFHEKRRTGKTVVLVTHDMATVQALCHRAMLIHDGELSYIGEPEETALRYYRLNFADQDRSERQPAELGPEQESGELDSEPERVHELNVRVVRAELRTQSGRSVENIENGAPIVIDVLFEAARELLAPMFVFHVVNAEGTVVFSFSRTLDQPIAARQRVLLTGGVENRLVAGRHYLDCWIGHHDRGRTTRLQALRLLSFVVYGTAPSHGVVALDADIEAVVVDH